MIGGGTYSVKFAMIVFDEERTKLDQKLDKVRLLGPADWTNATLLVTFRVASRELELALQKNHQCHRCRHMEWIPQFACRPVSRKICAVSKYYRSIPCGNMRSG